MAGQSFKYGKGDQPIPGYVLIEYLGSGQYGEVWKALRISTDVHVAIKMIDLSMSSSALKEVRALQMYKNLNHPNLVATTDFQLKSRTGQVISLAHAEDYKSRGELAELVIVMQLAEKSLAARLREFNPPSQPMKRGIPADELLGYMMGAAKGIDYLNQPVHKFGAGAIGPIIHCDVKPDNIMLVAGEAQIADCGVAVLIQEDVRKTQAAYSPAYSPSELSRNKPVVGTDQYCLAVSYYELRTGFLPFDQDDLTGGATALLVAHLQGKLNFNSPILKPGERDVLRWATNPLSEKRYEKCVQMVQQLQRGWEGQDVLSPEQSKRQSSPLTVPAARVPASELVPAWLDADELPPPPFAPAQTDSGNIDLFPSPDGLKETGIPNKGSRGDFRIMVDEHGNSIVVPRLDEYVPPTDPAAPHDGYGATLNPRHDETRSLPSLQATTNPTESPSRPIEVLPDPPPKKEPKGKTTVRKSGPIAPPKPRVKPGLPLGAKVALVVGAAVVIGLFGAMIFSKLGKPGQSKPATTEPARSPDHIPPVPDSIKPSLGGGEKVDDGGKPQLDKPPTPDTDRLKRLEAARAELRNPTAKEAFTKAIAALLDTTTAEDRKAILRDVLAKRSATEPQRDWALQAILQPNVARDLDPSQRTMVINWAYETAESARDDLVSAFAKLVQKEPRDEDLDTCRKLGKEYVDKCQSAREQIRTLGTDAAEPLTTTRLVEAVGTWLEADAQNRPELLATYLQKPERDELIAMPLAAEYLRRASAETPIETLRAVRNSSRTIAGATKNQQAIVNEHYQERLAQHIRSLLSKDVANDAMRQLCADDDAKGWSAIVQAEVALEAGRASDIRLDSLGTSSSNAKDHKDYVDYLRARAMPSNANYLDQLARLLRNSEPKLVAVPKRKNAAIEVLQSRIPDAFDKLEFTVKQLIESPRSEYVRNENPKRVQDWLSAVNRSTNYSDPVMLLHEYFATRQNKQMVEPLIDRADATNLEPLLTTHPGLLMTYLERRLAHSNDLSKPSDRKMAALFVRGADRVIEAAFANKSPTECAEIQKAAIKSIRENRLKLNTPVAKSALNNANDIDAVTLQLANIKYDYWLETEFKVEYLESNLEKLSSLLAKAKLRTDPLRRAEALALRAAINYESLYAIKSNTSQSADNRKTIWSQIQSDLSDSLKLDDSNWLTHATRTLVTASDGPFNLLASANDKGVPLAFYLTNEEIANRLANPLVDMKRLEGLIFDLQQTTKHPRIQMQPADNRLMFANIAQNLGYRCLELGQPKLAATAFAVALQEAEAAAAVRAKSKGSSNYYPDERQIGLAHAFLTFVGRDGQTTSTIDIALKHLLNAPADVANTNPNAKTVLQGRIDTARFLIECAERGRRTLNAKQAETQLKTVLEDAEKTDRYRKAQAQYWLGKLLATQKKSDAAIEQWTNAKDTLNDAITNPSGSNVGAPTGARWVYVQSCIALCEQYLDQRDDAQFQKHFEDLRACYDKGQNELEPTQWAVIPYLTTRSALGRGEQQTARETTMQLARVYRTKRDTALVDEPFVVRAFATALRDCRQLSTIEQAELAQHLRDLQRKYAWRFSNNDRELVKTALDKIN